MLEEYVNSGLLSTRLSTTTSTSQSAVFIQPYTKLLFNCKYEHPKGKTAETALSSNRCSSESYGASPNELVQEWSR